MAIRLTLEVGANDLEAAADLLDTFADRAPSSSRWGIHRVAEKLREGAEVDRETFPADHDAG